MGGSARPQAEPVFGRGGELKWGQMLRSELILPISLKVIHCLKANNRLRLGFDCCTFPLLANYFNELYTPSSLRYFEPDHRKSNDPDP